MSEHEYWNELGNLYFIAGAYEPAIHAYARSIELERGFGRPYSNLALAFVHTGKYEDAIELYQRSLELLSDAKEKAITWNRLGFLYREIKDYQNATAAYEQAARLDSQQDEMREEASRNTNFPLSIYISPVDLNAILERQEGIEAGKENLVEDLNEELEVAGMDEKLQWFEGDFAPPSPEPATEHLTEESELLNQVSLSMEEEGWIPLVFEDETLTNVSLEMDTELTHEEAAAISSAWQTQFERPVQEDKFDETSIAEAEPPAVSEERPDSPAFEFVSNHQTTDQSGDELAASADESQPEIAGNETALENQWANVNGFQTGHEERIASDEGRPETAGNETALGNQWTNVNGFQTGHEEAVPSDEDQPEAAENEAAFDTHSMDVTGHETIQYSQVEYPLIERTPAEINSIQIDVARFKRIIQINPRNAFAWETLGGLYKSLGKFKDAITSYQQAIALDSTKPSYFYQLGLVYSAERRDDEAMDAFQRVLSMDPQHTLANASLGSYYRKMGLNDLAQKHIDIALKDVYEEENEYNQACLEAICGNTDRALELLQVAIEDNPSYINWAQHDPDLDILRNDQRFYMMIQSFAQAR